MIYYRLNIEPKEDEPEGADQSEWFVSLREAQQRRSQLIRATDVATMKIREDYSIDRCVTNEDLTPKGVLFAVLNRSPDAWQKIERMVRPWTPSQRRRS